MTKQSSLFEALIIQGETVRNLQVTVIDRETPASPSDSPSWQEEMRTELRES